VRHQPIEHALAVRRRSQPRDCESDGVRASSRWDLTPANVVPVLRLSSFPRSAVSSRHVFRRGRISVSGHTQNKGARPSEV
jgi:hypothetical protein